MYKSSLSISLICVSLFFGTHTNAQKPISIGTKTPDSSAMLDIFSNTKGLLPPRLSFQQRNQIVSPSTGLIIWCSNCNVKGEMQVFDGVEWKKIGVGDALAPMPPISNPELTGRP